MAKLPLPLPPDWKPRQPGWRLIAYEVIFEADTPAGKAFDMLLLGAILLNVLAVILESVVSFRLRFMALFMGIEWAFTLLFTCEYLVRLAAVRQPWRYARSFFGVVDLLAIVPTYLSLWVSGTHYLTVIRTMRLLRVFRILKLARFMGEAQQLLLALKASREKILVFLSSVLVLVTILGTLMYVIEGGEHGFTSIPRSIYWAVVTLTTVGYGDIAPRTVLGQSLASLIMILGYAILAVPTGIVTVELANLHEPRLGALRGRGADLCPACGQASWEGDAHFCKYCGQAFPPAP
ncbi:MAG: ion transporter [Candidatus Sericytochromatia bacterium]